MEKVTLLVIEDRNTIQRILNDYKDHTKDIEVLLEMPNQKNLQTSITKTLHELGIPSNIKGYQYLKEGIDILYHHPSFIEGVTKELYPTIAKKYHSTTARVERDMRHAIEVSWNRANWDFMEEVFGYSIDTEKAKPTNSEFIATIADKLRLE